MGQCVTIIQDSCILCNWPNYAQLPNGDPGFKSRRGPEGGLVTIIMGSARPD